MDDRPNILHVITHDTGRHLECYGEDVKTPNINRFAGEGVKFTNYFCAAPQCSPSRASMFSGLMPHNNGMIGLAHRGFSLNPDVPYLPQVLAESGYHTYLFGVQHEAEDVLGEPDVNIRGPGRLGYQKILRADSPSCADVVPLLNEFLCGDPPQPFFISAGFSETHRPFPEVEKPPHHLRVPRFLPDDFEVKQDVAGINVLVEKVDTFVGEMLETLKNAGLEENTLVVFTTDHGIAFPGAKATLFDPGIEILLIARGPGGFEGGREVDALLSNLDLTPTLLNCAGIGVPPGMQGKSFLPIVRGEQDKIRDEVYFELTYHAAYDPMRGLRMQDYKYIRNFEVRSFFFPPNVDDGISKGHFRSQGYYDRLRPFEFLFDLKKDPLERKNLVGEPQYDATLQTLRAKLFEWMKQTGDPLLEGPVPLPEGAIVTPPWEYSARVHWFANEEWVP